MKYNQNVTTTPCQTKSYSAEEKKSFIIKQLLWSMVFLTSGSSATA
jgi:hypothetical protein